MTREGLKPSRKQYDYDEDALNVVRRKMRMHFQ
jgi:hypothetical protein